jgi:hypothetical protein
MLSLMSEYLVYSGFPAGYATWLYRFCFSFGFAVYAGWPCLLCWPFGVDGYSIYAG